VVLPYLLQKSIFLIRDVSKKLQKIHSNRIGNDLNHFGMIEFSQFPLHLMPTFLTC